MSVANLDTHSSAALAEGIIIASEKAILFLKREPNRTDLPSFIKDLTELVKRSGLLETYLPKANETEMCEFFINKCEAYLKSEECDKIELAQLFGLKLHRCKIFRGGLHVRRVAGGWIYNKEIYVPNP